AAGLARRPSLWNFIFWLIPYHRATAGGGSWGFTEAENSTIRNLTWNLGKYMQILLLNLF
ncbi:MAG: hypothetical protein AAFY26_24015, partial [Cyanobacteria bacterium J06638_22]